MTATFSAIGIVTGDLAASADFYRRLGCDLGAVHGDEPHLEWAGPGGVRLMWDPVSTVRRLDPDWQPPVGGPALALAFDCGTPAALDELVSDLVADGVTVANEPFDAPWGQRYATVLDPDGNSVDLFAKLA